MMWSRRAAYAKVLVALLSVVLLCVTTPAYPQAVLARKGVQELFELMTRQLGREAADELLTKVGREGVEELIERVAKEGGEQAVERVVKLGGAHGAQAIRVLKESPTSIVHILDDLPPTQVKSALNALERDPKVLTRIIEEHGPRALTTELRHPGVGAHLVQSFGDDGARLGEKLSTDEVIRLSRYADEIQELPAPAREAFLNRVVQAPQEVLGQLEKSPNVLKLLEKLGIAGIVTVGATKAVVAVGNPVFAGTEETTDAEGIRHTKKGWLVEGVVAEGLGRAAEKFGSGAGWMLILLGIMIPTALAGFLLFRRLPRSKGAHRKRQ